MRLLRLLMLVSVISASVQGYAGEWDGAYIDSVFTGRYLDPIEGIWQFPKGGAKIAIKKSKANSFEIFLLDSPRLDIKPGTLIGNVVTTPKKNYYDGELKSSKLGKKDKLPSQTVTFTVTDDGTLAIRPYKTGYSLSLKRWLSFLTKITIVDNSNKRPADLDGAVRIYPYITTEHLPVCL